ncbi:hypothetical protein IT568_03010 [bacterium]|nr:hypothetical protein [bacterium]
MENEKFTEVEFHKKMAVELYNFVWSLMDKKERSQEETDTMIHSAHASAFHWSKVGKPLQFSIGEWQISRVYTLVPIPESAIFHAKRCLEICLENGIEDFALAYAYESLARAYSVANDKEQTQFYLAIAKEKGELIKEQDDKELFFSDIATVQN